MDRSVEIPEPLAPKFLNPGRVCVVITAYNAARYIERAVASVLSQTWSDLKAIVVDDGSTDDTADVIRSLPGNIELLQLAENRGPAVGRTMGLDHADGEFVAFLDADDYWLPGMVEATVGFLVENPKAVAVYTGYRKLDWDGITYDRPVLRPEDESYAADGGVMIDDLYAFWAKYSNILTGTVMMRTEVARLTGGQREDLRLTQDLEFWGYLATFGPWGFIRQPFFMTDECVLTSAERLRKFRRRFSFFSGMEVENWSRRIRTCLPEEGEEGFSKIEVKIATTILIANAYSLNFKQAWQLAKKWHGQLDGSIGKFLSLGVRCGRLSWPLFCIAVPFREHFKARVLPLYRRLKAIGRTQ